MKILHTADWHIGKTLHKHSLQEELQLFFTWLLEQIKSQKIDVLLVSGDVFDLANPSAQDRKMYYQFLSELSHLNIKTIITGGNHDSAGFLNAPSKLLHAFDITVIGEAVENLENELIPIKNKNGQTEFVVAAVPFLKDKDLRNQQTDEKFKNRTEAIREGIKKHYNDLVTIAAKKYTNYPLIAMGHLYTIGVDPTESERDIHVGNAAAIDGHLFESFAYAALGHIHRPQIIAKNQMIRYSGSPIALSFSEKKDQKSIVILEYKDKKFLIPEIINVPKSRELKRISGTLEKVRNELQEYTPDFPLPSFVEIEIIEPNFSTVILSEVENLRSEFEEKGTFSILKSKTTFGTGAKNAADLFESGENIEDLKPIDVFNKRIESEDLNEETLQHLRGAFQELLELIDQNES